MHGREKVKDVHWSHSCRTHPKTDSIYTIEDLVSGKRITTHNHNLRPFIYEPIRTNPLTVAQHNEQEFIVESILGLCNRRSTLQFDVSNNSWEPYKALKHVDKRQRHEDAHSTENLSQNFPGLLCEVWSMMRRRKVKIVAHM